MANKQIAILATLALALVCVLGAGIYMMVVRGDLAIGGSASTTLTATPEHGIFGMPANSETERLNSLGYDFKWHSPTSQWNYMGESPHIYTSLMYAGIFTDGETPEGAINAIVFGSSMKTIFSDEVEYPPEAIIAFLRDCNLPASRIESWLIIHKDRLVDEGEDGITDRIDGLNMRAKYIPGSRTQLHIWWP